MRASRGSARSAADDQVHCTSYYSQLDPLEHGEVRLLPVRLLPVRLLPIMILPVRLLPVRTLLVGVLPVFAQIAFSTVCL